MMNQLSSKEEDDGRMLVPGDEKHDCTDTQDDVDEVVLRKPPVKPPRTYSGLDSNSTTTSVSRSAETKPEGHDVPESQTVSQTGTGQPGLVLLDQPVASDVPATGNHAVVAVKKKKHKKKSRENETEAERAERKRKKKLKKASRQETSNANPEKTSLVVVSPSSSVTGTVPSSPSWLVHWRMFARRNVWGPCLSNCVRVCLICFYRAMALISIVLPYNIYAFKIVFRNHFNTLHCPGDNLRYTSFELSR